jgi:alpha-glucosidase (family GH31 glycosyl hydrolase)
MLNKKQVLKHVCLKLLTALLMLCINISAKASVISYKKDTNGLIFKLDRGFMYIGDKYIGTATPVDLMSLYKGAGAIVPMGSDFECTTRAKNKVIESRIYPGADGSFKFYEDENGNYNYEKGYYATFTLVWNNKLKELRISDTKGTFSGMLGHRIFNVVVGGVNMDRGRYKLSRLIRELYTMAML